jgi:RimJ/RimL family protein N-acetyltransferase
MPRRLAHFSDPRLDAQIGELIKKHKELQKEMQAAREAGKAVKGYALRAVRYIYSGGRLMRLTTLISSDIPVIEKWLSDKELLDLIRIDPPRPDMPVLTTIIRLDDETPVGWIDLFNIDHVNMKAEAGIAIPDERGRGLAGVAGKQYLALVFEAWGFNRITCRILASNQYAIKCAELFGFIREGVERQAIYRDGKFEDVIVFAMLRDDFRKKVMGHGRSSTVHPRSAGTCTTGTDSSGASCSPSCS